MKRAAALAACCGLVVVTGHNPQRFAGCRVEPSTTPQGYELIVYPHPTVITVPGFEVPCPAGTITWAPSDLPGCRKDCGTP